MAHMAHQNSHGIIRHDNSDRQTDYLYRISLKCLIRNQKGEVLTVKEIGRDYWDLPGGGMDHGEDIRGAIAREMKEEVNLYGDFAYRIIAVEEPGYLRPHNFWQIRLIFEVEAENMQFSPGDDGDEVTFVDPLVFKDSAQVMEQRIFVYSTIQ